MERCSTRAAWALFALLLGGAPLASQAPPPAHPDKPPAVVPEPKLMFDREVYRYPGTRLRDPFHKIKAGTGPRFDDLVLRGIIFSGEQSVVVLVDSPTKKTYKVHRGQIVGNARVVQIDPARVTFTVENFGQSTTEMLELKRKTEGAT